MPDSEREPVDDGAELLRCFAEQIKSDNEYSVPDGLARSIWEDKYARKVENGSYESWADRLRQVAVGNHLLIPQMDRFSPERMAEFADAVRLSVEGVMAYSGRQLQHGDLHQPEKIMDLFSNCATSPLSFLTLWKSLCGKGVSSDYSSHARPVNWDLMPNLRLVLDGGSDDSGEVSKGAHPDFARSHYEFQGGMESLREARHKYPSDSEWVRWFEVDDSREGWAQVVCALETAAYHERHRDKLFIFDLSKVRCAGSPIAGHQGRPASGPIPLMRCLLKVATVKGAFMDPWKQAMYVDDYMAQCVSIGGVRRNARMAVMYWKDSAVFDFIQIKRGGHLRMANNTILVDEEFWEQRKDPRTKAHMVFQQAMAAAYYDQTGEPGFANIHNMRQNREGIEKLTSENYLNLEACGLNVHLRTYDLIDKVLSALKRAPYICIPNPCGEADLTTTGDDCLVGDVGLQRARTVDDAMRAAELMGRALVRVSSQMPAMCQAERRRTNKVGVSAVGFLEFFWNHWKLGFYNLLEAHDYFIHPEKYQDDWTVEADVPGNKILHTAIEAWGILGQVAARARFGAGIEALTLGVVVPDTATLLKPGGTVAKVLCTQESANLFSRRYVLRFTQHVKEIKIPLTTLDVAREDAVAAVEYVTVLNPKVEEYRRRGYPVQDISHKYPGYVVVGFPTVQPYIRQLDEEGFGDKIATANNVSVEDHYKWLRLLEYHWLGCRPNGEPAGGQIAYTLKYNPRNVSYDEFMRLVAENQPTVRCCTFNVCSSDEELFAETQEMIANYGWSPETPLTRDEYEQLMARIDQISREDYDDSISCESGVCAVDSNINEN